MIPFSNMAAPIVNMICRRRGLGLLCQARNCATLASSSSESSLAEKFRTAKEKSTGKLRPLFRTSENDPANHSTRHEGLFYTITEEDSKKWLEKGLNKYTKQQMTTFGESCLMVRQPAVEVMEYLKAANYNLPVIRYALYGKDGSGKTCSLSHILHYCATQGWLIVNAPWPFYWFRHFKDIAPSSYKPGRVDLPIEAVDWIKQFRQQNAGLLQTLDMKTTRRYVWSHREATEEGSPLSEVMDLGLNRVKYASDCVGVILREIRAQSPNLGVKTLVAVDGVNAFWSETKIKLEDRSKVPVDKVSLVHHFKKMIKNDWTNGAVVTTVDRQASPEDNRDSYTPRYLLQKEGFEWMEPFVPIQVDNYSDKEVQSCLDYYIDRLWIQNPAVVDSDVGRKELIYKSNKNPFQLMRVAASL